MEPGNAWPLWATICSIAVLAAAVVTVIRLMFRLGQSPTELRLVVCPEEGSPYSVLFDLAHTPEGPPSVRACGRFGRGCAPDCDQACARKLTAPLHDAAIPG